MSEAMLNYPSNELISGHRQEQHLRCSGFRAGAAWYGTCVTGHAKSRSCFLVGFGSNETSTENGPTQTMPKFKS